MGTNEDNVGRGSRSDLVQLAGLWTKAQPAVTAYIRSVILNFHDAEDVLQHVAQEVAHKFEQYDATRPFTPWALGIARYKIMEYLRAKTSDRLVFSEQTIDILANTSQSMHSMYGEMSDALQYCLSQVKGRSKTAVELRYVRDMKPAKIARRMNMNPNSVSVLLHRVRESLAKCIRGKMKAKGNA